MVTGRQEVELEPRRVAELYGDGRTQVVDVREPYEWAAGRIAGARHIEMDDLAAAAASLDRERPVVFYCRVGARSGMAAHAFRRAGYEAYNLAGGLEAWVADGLPLEPPDGGVAPH
jgi:rhodanese-related sulfurtransferase